MKTTQEDFFGNSICFDHILIFLPFYLIKELVRSRAVADWFQKLVALDAKIIGVYLRR